MAIRMTSTPEHAAVTCVQLPGQETELAHAEMNQTQGGWVCNPLLMYVVVKVAKFVAETVFAEDCISE